MQKEMEETAMSVSETEFRADLEQAQTRYGSVEVTMTSGEIGMYEPRHIGLVLSGGFWLGAPPTTFIKFVDVSSIRWVTS